MKCVVSGSFRKFYDAIAGLVEDFEKCGIEVLSPSKSKIVKSQEEFVILESDKTDDIEILERNHLNAIKEADFLYIYNPEGYMGESTIMELGWALAMDKPVYSLEKSKDLALAKFIKVKSPADICKNRF
jgi:nucleoside 2-deoxyribosyltransferase